jgi:hypothetical protein
VDYANLNLVTKFTFRFVLESGLPDYGKVKIIFPENLFRTGM